MTNLIATFQDRFSDWLTALSQHLQLSLLTLLLAIFIAIPLAVYLRYHEKLADWVLQIAGIFQTIPSLALLESLQSAIPSPPTSHDSGDKQPKESR